MRTQQRMTEKETDLRELHFYIFTVISLLSTVPSRLQQSFLAWKNRLPQKAAPSLCVVSSNDPSGMFNLVSLPPVLGQKGRLRIESRSNSIS